MMINKNSLVLAAALLGWLRVRGPSRTTHTLGIGLRISAGLQADDSGAKMTIEKHACKGLNSCKGNGGGSKKEYGKNSCKGSGRLRHRRLKKVKSPCHDRGRHPVNGPFSYDNACKSL